VSLSVTTIRLSEMAAAQEVVTLTPVATDTGASIQVNDADVDLDNGPLTIDLSEGENRINLEGAAEDGWNRYKQLYHCRF
jgi:hypothetical protein